MPPDDAGSINRTPTVLLPLPKGERFPKLSQMFFKRYFLFFDK